jgi:hypothetical protein
MLPSALPVDVVNNYEVVDGEQITTPRTGFEDRMMSVVWQLFYEMWFMNWMLGMI